MDKKTIYEIEKVTWNTLREAGIIQPPVRIEPLLEHLQLHRDFYSLHNPSFLDRSKYKIRVHGKKLVNILQKIKLVAVLFYGEDRIVVDSELPEIRQDWPSFHESAHKILPWHKPYFYGDTAQTLDPDWHEILESEANYAASALMFCGPVFTKDACDMAKDWSTISVLKKHYGKTIMTTLRRYVEHGPEHPMAMLVSTPYWQSKPDGQIERWRHFVRSKKFADEFGSIKPKDLLTAVDSNSTYHRGGLVADFTFPLRDDNGDMHEFHFETFNNTYDLLTLCVENKKFNSKSIILPKGVHIVK